MELTKADELAIARMVLGNSFDVIDDYGIEGLQIMIESMINYRIDQVLSNIKVERNIEKEAK